MSPKRSSVYLMTGPSQLHQINTSGGLVLGPLSPFDCSALDFIRILLSERITMKKLFLSLISMALAGGVYAQLNTFNEGDVISAEQMNQS